MSADDGYPLTSNIRGEPPWRVGRKVGRTVYDRHDTLIGVFDTPFLATQAVDAFNDLARRQRRI